MSSVAKINWSRLTSVLQSNPSSLSSVLSLKKRFEEAQRKTARLEEQKVTLDLNSYKSLLKNQKIVANADSALKAFKPVKLDVGKATSGLDALQNKADSHFSNSIRALDEESQTLTKTLADIESSRAVEDLTDVELRQLFPDLDSKVRAQIYKEFVEDRKD